MHKAPNIERLACYCPDMDQPSSLVVCRAGHTAHYPAALETAANTGTDLAFCIACDCQRVHMVVLYSGERPRVVASGDVDLYARFEATEWPERVHTDEAGAFFYREMEPLGLALFLEEERRDHRPG
ncbi:hypothetical protein EFW17_10740 [Halostreptopolyspora alba]|uniref:Uncharacterized protein n=1 Tax=Halostreptopolyspora alba TaxID=2487137 RepID=A0A3N0EAI9_9ACTN|nr:hypothetical protein EFW17_10740 [Nocardiopsaceae bacterium YIM 96095]